MKTRCTPGDRCVIVADVPGCECNIGAELTVTDLVPDIIPPAWKFKDASRPLKMVACLVEPDGAREVVPWMHRNAVTETLVTPDYTSGMFDHHLVPIRPSTALHSDTLVHPVEHAA